MSIVSITDKLHPQLVMPGNWTTLTFEGQTEFAMNPGGRTLVHAQVYADLPNIGGPTAIELRTVRHPVGKAVDPTGHDVRAVPPTPTHWAGTYLIEMFTDPAIPISIEFRHNAKVSIELPTRIIKLVNLKTA